jgi:glycosyltransferase involved in cell wall biosynthesis
VLALIERYELQDRIYVPGFVDNVRTLMALSDVVVVPSTLAQLSHLEGFAGAKPFRISEGYPKVFTTGKGVGDLF